MRNFQLIVISVFIVVAIGFVSYFLYDTQKTDNTAPVITSDGTTLQLSVSATDKELCAGLNAADNVDGDITDKIIIRSISKLVGTNDAKIDYIVFDSSSNFCTFSRTIYYTDYQKPRFALSKPLVYNLGNTVTLLDRLTATDVIDSDITEKIRLSLPNISATSESDYRIQVQVTNSTGDTASLALTVSMQSLTSRHPQIELTDYILYFEDNMSTQPEDFRPYILSVYDAKNGTRVNAADVTISGEVDVTRAGSYDITFSYTNSEKLTSWVILTVVVE